jgi:Cys-tRNA(Pro) deacylase
VREPHVPVTGAVRALRAAGVSIEPFFYPYVDHGGTRQAALSLGVGEHAVVKTLVFEVDGGAKPRPLIVLMHGDREVSTKELARHLAVKTVAPATPAAVEKHTGYQPGGVSPFGTRHPLPVYVEATILDLPAIYLNGGKRGFLVRLAPTTLARLLGAEAVTVATG